MLEFFSGFIVPAVVASFSLTVLLFIRTLRAQRHRPRIDLEKLGIRVDDLRLATGEDRGPLALLRYPDGIQAEAGPNEIPPEDRVIILALDLLGKASKHQHPAEALAALRVAELLMAARCHEVQNAPGSSLMAA